MAYHNSSLKNIHCLLPVIKRLMVNMVLYVLATWLHAVCLQPHAMKTVDVEPYLLSFFNTEDMDLYNEVVRMMTSIHRKYREPEILIELAKRRLVLKLYNTSFFLVLVCIFGISIPDMNLSALATLFISYYLFLRVQSSTEKNCYTFRMVVWLVTYYEFYCRNVKFLMWLSGYLSYLILISCRCLPKCFVTTWEVKKWKNIWKKMVTFS